MAHTKTFLGASVVVLLASAAANAGTVNFVTDQSWDVKSLTTLGFTLNSAGDQATSNANLSPFSGASTAGVSVYADGTGAPGYWTNPGNSGNAFSGSGAHWISNNNQLGSDNWGDALGGTYLFEKHISAQYIGDPVSILFTFVSDNPVKNVSLGGVALPFTQVGVTYQVASTIAESGLIFGGLTSLDFDVLIENIPQAGNRNPMGLLGVATVSYTDNMPPPASVPLPAGVYGGMGLLGGLVAYRRIRRGR